MLKAGRIDEETFARLEDRVMPTCGSCTFMGTANSMCCVSEALGLTLPGSAAIPAPHADRLRAAQASGRRIVEMVEEGLNARQIIRREGLENAIRVAAAIGGSTNVALHLPAVAHEAGQSLPLEVFDRLCRATPHIAKVYPAAPANVPDFHQAGGVPAVMKQLLPLLHQGARTVTGKTVAENVRNAPDPDREIIRPLSDPWSPEGGLAVLKGNLAPLAGVTRPAAIHPHMHVFSGRARCFDSEDQANQAILEGVIQPGDVIVIRYEGPRGGPGMREMSTAMKLLYGRGLALQTALITDGRFSGTNNGCFVGHISPEAAAGGPIAVVRDGDRITIDVPARTLNLALTDREIQDRLAAWTPPPSKYKTGYLAQYAALASSAAEGAVLKP